MWRAVLTNAFHPKKKNVKKILTSHQNENIKTYEINQNEWKSLDILLLIQTKNCLIFNVASHFKHHPLIHILKLYAT
jgi:hypothetical protein